MRRRLATTDQGNFKDNAFRQECQRGKALLGLYFRLNVYLFIEKVNMFAFMAAVIRLHLAADSIKDASVKNKQML